MQIFSEADVKRVLRMDALVPAMRDALVALSSGRVAQPPRQIVPVAEHAGFLGAMPAYYGGALGAKLVTFYPDNRGVPTHHAVIVLFEPATGAPLALMDGRLVTEMRTAAVSAASADLLARRDARTLGIVGAGVQAHSHLEALALVRRFDEVRVWSPRGAAAFAERHAERYGVHAAASAEDAVRGADVVLVATTSKVPVLRGAWVAPGAHVIAVGAVRPDWRELDDDLLRGRRVYVDARDAVLRESGDAILAASTGGEIVELGEALAGTRPGRASADEITLFKSVGVAVEDLAAAALVYRAALGGGSPST